MAFEESQSWYTLVTEVCVAFYTVLNKMADAMIKKRKLYRIYRSGGRLGVLTPAGGQTERRKR